MEKTGTFGVPVSLYSYIAHLHTKRGIKMNTNRKPSFFKLSAIPAAILATVILLTPETGRAAETDHVLEVDPSVIPNQAFLYDSASSGALTPPPPASSPFESFAQSLLANQYLGAAYNNIHASGNDAIQITAVTSGTSSAAQTGVTAFVQRWNGTDWELYGPSKTNSSKTLNASVNYSMSVKNGYYYRIKSEHWASKGASRESNMIYSNTLPCL